MSLSDYMSEHGITGQALAKILGVSHQAVFKWASGERVPRPLIMLRIMEVTKGQVTLESFYELARKNGLKRRHGRTRRPAQASNKIVAAKAA
jgi:predicted transcriptional regulator